MNTSTHIGWARTTNCKFSQDRLNALKVGDVVVYSENGHMETKVGVFAGVHIDAWEHPVAGAVEGFKGMVFGAYDPLTSTVAKIVVDYLDSLGELEKKDLGIA